MRIVIVGAVAALLVATPAVSTAGGMTSFEFQEDYVLVGESVAGRAVFYTSARGSGRIENGPWHAYLLPGGTWIEPPRIPEGAVDLGPITIEERGDGTALATIPFTVPEVTTGGYFIGMCNVPCTEAYVGDLGGGWLSIAHTEEGATLLRSLDNTEAQLQRIRYRLAQRIKDAERPVVDVESRLDGLEGSVELRLREIEDRIRTLSATDTADGSVPWMTALFAGGVAVAAAVLVVRRRRKRVIVPTPQEPPIVEWEIREEVSART